MQTCWTEPAIWIAEESPPLPSDQYEFQWQNKWRSVPCEIKEYKTHSGGLCIRLHQPMRCIAPGQCAALYKGNICLGGAVIKSAKSLFEEGKIEHYNDWCLSNYEVYPL